MSSPTSGPALSSNAAMMNLLRAARGGRWPRNAVHTSIPSAWRSLRPFGGRRLEVAAGLPTWPTKDRKRSMTNFLPRSPAQTLLAKPARLGDAWPRRWGPQRGPTDSPRPRYGPDSFLAIDCPIRSQWNTRRPEVAACRCSRCQTRRPSVHHRGECLPSGGEARTKRTRQNVTAGEGASVHRTSNVT